MQRSRSVLALLLAISLAAPASMAHAAGPFLGRIAATPKVKPVSASLRRTIANRLARGGKMKLAPARMKIEHDEPPPSFGERVADKVARFAGSWKFLFLLSAGTSTWMAAHNFLGDPELIKLNLGISIVTMLTGPLVLMSQNRSGERDRLRGEKDLQVDIKAEKEIAELHDKMDKMGAQLEKMAAAMEAQAAVKQSASKPN